MKIPDRLYDILVVVKLIGDQEDSINLENSQIFILTKGDVNEIIGEKHTIGLNTIKDKIFSQPVY